MTAGWQLRAVGGLKYYELAAGPVRLLFTTRAGGVSRGDFAELNLSFDVTDDIRRVSENWARLRTALPGRPVVTLRQVHSSTVLPIMYDKTPAELLEGDGCFTDERGPSLGVKVADCLPVYVFAADGRCRAVAHCGWRGTAGRLAEKLSRQIAKRFGLPLPDLRFCLGPAICGGCYTVGDDVRQAIAESYPVADRFLSPVAAGSRRAWRLDLRAANRWLLGEMGLTEVASLDLCTRENVQLLYSARRRSPTGRSLAVIAAA